MLVTDLNTKNSITVTSPELLQQKIDELTEWSNPIERKIKVTCENLKQYISLMEYIEGIIKNQLKDTINLELIGNEDGKLKAMEVKSLSLGEVKFTSVFLPELGQVELRLKGDNKLINNK